MEPLAFIYYYYYYYYYSGHHNAGIKSKHDGSLPLPSTQTLLSCSQGFSSEGDSRFFLL